MVIKNTKLGGTDLSTNEKLKSVDLNDTFTACDTYKNNNYNYSLAPIGAIVAYHFNYSGSHQVIPTGWVNCNGNIIIDPESVYNGQLSPALNGTTEDNSRFLRGNTTSGGTGGTSVHGHGYAHIHVVYHSDGGPNYHSSAPEAAANIPNYFSVKWIMRIK